MTPGAASATKSNVLASGPMRPSNGIFTNSRRYSRSASSVFIVIADRFGATVVGSNSNVPTSKAWLNAPLASISQTSVRRP